MRVEHVDLGRMIQVDPLARAVTLEDDELERAVGSGRLRGQLGPEGVGDHLAQRRTALRREALGSAQQPFVEGNRRSHASQHTMHASLHHITRRWEPRRGASSGQPEVLVGS